MTAWKQSTLAIARDVLRFAIWFCIVLNGLMLSLFTIVFTAMLLFRAMGYAFREWFAQPW